MAVEIEKRAGSEHLAEAALCLGSRPSVRGMNLLTGEPELEV
jgi:hypothetical protein